MLHKPSALPDSNALAASRVLVALWLGIVQKAAPHQRQRIQATTLLTPPPTTAPTMWTSVWPRSSALPGSNALAVSRVLVAVRLGIVQKAARHPRQQIQATTLLTVLAVQTTPRTESAKLSACEASGAVAVCRSPAVQGGMVHHWA